MPSAKVGDINMEYYVEGTGPPLLMIMGWIGNAGFWGEAFLERLRPHFQIIRLSNRGTGLTDKPGGDYSIRTMAEDAAGLLRELGIERAHVLGISMGGMIAQELALNHPPVVQGLVLGCTTCGFVHGVPPSAEVVTGSGETGNLPPPDRIRQFVEVGVSIDSFGVGSYIAGAPPNDFTGDIHEVDGKPIAKRGRIPGVTNNPRLTQVL